MILHSEYLKAQQIIDEYNTQSKQSVINISDLSINQKVKRKYPGSWYYWVSEIKGEDVLIRTTDDKEDPMLDDFWVNIAELRIA